MPHYLAGIATYNALIGHALVGTSWEGYVINQIRAVLRSDDEMYFYRTQDGAEIDLLLSRNDKWLYAIEIEFTNGPSLSRGTL